MDEVGFKPAGGFGVVVQALGAVTWAKQAVAFRQREQGGESGTFGQFDFGLLIRVSFIPSVVHNVLQYSKSPSTHLFSLAANVKANRSTRRFCNFFAMTRLTLGESPMDADVAMAKRPT